MDKLKILGHTKRNRQGKKDGKGGRKEDEERSNPATFSHLVVVVIVMLGMVMVMVVIVMAILVVMFMVLLVMVMAMLVVKVMG